MKHILLSVLLIGLLSPLDSVSQFYPSGDLYFQAIGFSKEGNFSWQIIKGSHVNLHRQDLITDEEAVPFSLKSIDSTYQLKIVPWDSRGYKNLKVHSVDIQRNDSRNDDTITGVRIIASKNNREKELAVWKNLKVKEIKQKGYIKSPYENRLAVIIELISEEATEIRIVGCYGDIEK